MCCFLTVLLLLGPRVAGVIWWIARPIMWQAAFNGAWIWPVLGIIFLPWATLMYVLFAGNGGVTGFEWVWVGLGVLADIASYGGGGYGNREHLPMYNRPTTL
jgi:hypothetical protein